MNSFLVGCAIPVERARREQYSDVEMSRPIRSISRSRGLGTNKREGHKTGTLEAKRRKQSRNRERWTRLTRRRTGTAPPRDRYNVRQLSDYYDRAGLGGVPLNHMGMIEQVRVQRQRGWCDEAEEGSVRVPAGADGLSAAAERCLASVHDWCVWSVCRRALARGKEVRGRGVLVCSSEDGNLVPSRTRRRKGRRGGRGRGSRVRSGRSPRQRSIMRRGVKELAHGASKQPSRRLSPA